MKLTTQQVAEKLGVGGETVRRMRDAGKLTDVAQRKEGKSKHYSLYESADIAAYLKENGRGKQRQSPVSENGSGPGPVAFLTRIDTRLSNLESMMTQLLKVWS